MLGWDQHLEHWLVSAQTHSLPSGHAASSFACAVVLSAYVPRWRVPLFVLAALVAFSRCYAASAPHSKGLAGSLAGDRLRRAGYCKIPKLVWISRSAMSPSTIVISAITATATQ